MEMILNSFLGAVCVVLAVTGLLTQRLRGWQYLFLLIYVEGMAVWGIRAGQIIAVLMIPGVFGLLWFMLRERKLENICLACIGYLLNLLCNNLVLLVCGVLLHIPAKVIDTRYYAVFSIVYILILGLLLFGIRHVLNSNSKVLGVTETPGVVRYGLLVNLFLFVIIFLVMISLGQRAGYSKEALLLNCALFTVCMFVSSILIINCTNSIKAAEEKRAEEQQRKILQDYITNLEKMLDDTKAFRHDYKNVLSTMAGFIRENQIEELKSFFNKQIRVTAADEEAQNDAWKCVRLISPIELKGFLYEKVLSAFARDIQIHIAVKEEICVEYEPMKDLVRLLGIFIDNALEAAESAEEGAVWIVISGTQKGVLFRIENNFREKPDISQMYLKGWSTKGEGRGLGLYNSTEILSRHLDMFHELSIMEDKVIQYLEVEKEV